MQLELTADEDGTQHYPINPIHDCDTAYLEVAKAEERPLLAKAEVFLADDSNDKVEEGYIDLAKQSLFKLGVALRASEGRTYEGPVKMWSEDMATKERTQVQGIDDEVIVLRCAALQLLVAQGQPTVGRRPHLSHHRDGAMGGRGCGAGTCR